MPNDIVLPNNALAGLLIAIGAIQCFYGYRAFKVVLVFVGFVLGYALGFMTIESMFHHRYAAFLVGIVAGVVAGSLINNVYLIGVFIVSALFGGAVALQLYAIGGQHPEPTMLFIFAVLAGLLALFFQKLMIIVATALSGAWGVVGGIAWFATAAIDPVNLASVQKIFRAEDAQGYIIVACWLVLGVIGVLFQYQRLPGMKSDYISDRQTS